MNPTEAAAGVSSVDPASLPPSLARPGGAGRSRTDRRRCARGGTHLV